MIMYTHLSLHISRLDLLRIEHVISVPVEEHEKVKESVKASESEKKKLQDNIAANEEHLLEELQVLHDACSNLISIPTVLVEKWNPVSGNYDQSWSLLDCIVNSF
jgi:hypothetical protein